MDAVKAVVQKVFAEGPHGPWAVATTEQLEGSVTFSLEPTSWKEDEWPTEGAVVHLSEMRTKRAGWRAKEGRFWKPSDEQGAVGDITFLYPTSRQFPFDEVCSTIVRELERRGWQVPGIEVEFHLFGSGAQKLRMVQYIRSSDFKLWFCRSQGKLPGGHYNNLGAVTEIVIPYKEIHVYEDESGPSYYLYVGNDYARDREQFMHGLKVNSKLHGEPRSYLRYKGSWQRPEEGGPHYIYPGTRAPYLVADNDLEREYDPEGDEPKFFRTDEVLAEFDRYLREQVLARIRRAPIAKKTIDPFAEPEPIPFPDLPIFCFGEYCDAERIKQGKSDRSKLPLAERYGLIGSGYRLVSLDVPDDGTIPELAYDGFLWCGIGKVSTEIPIESLEIPGHCRWPDRERFVIRITPNRANDIYVADHGQYEKRRKEIWDSIDSKREELTSEEVADFVRARARTIVPISEYQGGFDQPVVLVNRELGFDEVEVVSGPHKDRYGR